MQQLVHPEHLRVGVGYRNCGDLYLGDGGGSVFQGLVAGRQRSGVQCVACGCCQSGADWGSHHWVLLGLRHQCLSYRAFLHFRHFGGGCLRQLIVVSAQS